MFPNVTVNVAKFLVYLNSGCIRCIDLATCMDCRYKQFGRCGPRNLQPGSCQLQNRIQQSKGHTKIHLSCCFPSVTWHHCCVSEPAWQRKSIPHRNSRSWWLQRPARVSVMETWCPFFASLSIRFGTSNREIQQNRHFCQSKYWKKMQTSGVSISKMLHDAKSLRRTQDHSRSNPHLPRKDSWVRTNSIHDCSRRLPSHHHRFDRTARTEPCRTGADLAFAHLG